MVIQMYSNSIRIKPVIKVLAGYPKPGQTGRGVKACPKGNARRQL